MTFDNFIQFYKPLVAECPPAAFFVSAKNTPPKLAGHIFQNLLLFIDFEIVDLLLLALNQVEIYILGMEVNEVADALVCQSSSRYSSPSRTTGG